MGKIELNIIYNEDCLETMKRMPDNYLHAIVTDPPYGLSFMGKAWDYDVPKVEIWIEALRVLKPGGHLLAFAGSRTYHRMAVAIEDAEFEIRDQLIWMYGSGFPKSLNIGKAVDKLQGNEREDLGIRQGATGKRNSKIYGDRPVLNDPDYQPRITKGTSEWEGYGTALKPAHEPCVLARKPLDGTVANNVLKHGTGGLAIDKCRIPTSELKEQKAKGSNGGEAYGDYNLDAMYTPSMQGRFPANLILDGSPEVEAVFPQNIKPSFRKGDRASNNNGIVPWNKGRESGRSVTGAGFTDGGSASRYFYTAKASKRERGQGNNHPTVKPIALMKYLVKLVAPPKNGIIYDPFSGSGTTLLACQKLGIDFIGSEISKEYCDIATKRLAQGVLL